MNLGPILAFGAAGTAGFVIDAAVLQLLVRVFGVSPFVARVPSFLVAVAVTWWINRSFAFRSEREKRARAVREEYLRYLGVQTVGAFINYAVYACALLWRPEWQRLPVWGVALGSAVAMVFNYVGCRILVYGSSPAPRVGRS